MMQNNDRVHDSVESYGFVPNVFFLFFYPSKFFRQAALPSRPFIIFALTWLLGITLAWKIPSHLAAYMIPSVNPDKIFFLSSWGWYWLIGVVFGLMSGVVCYVAWGFLFRIRIFLSGGRDVDLYLARRIFIYSSFIAAAPVLLDKMVATFLLPSPAADIKEIGIYDFLSSGFWVLAWLWAIYAGYRGVRTCFDVKKWWCRFWFLFIPLAGTVVMAYKALEQPWVTMPSEINASLFSMQYAGNWEVTEQEDDFVRIEPLQDVVIEIAAWNKELDEESPEEKVKAFFSEDLGFETAGAEFKEIHEWGKYKGFGYRVVHEVDDTPCVTTLFVGGNNLCSFLVHITGLESDMKSVEPGIRLIHNSFRLQE